MLTFAELAASKPWLAKAILTAESDEEVLAIVARSRARRSRSRGDHGRGVGRSSRGRRSGRQCRARSGRSRGRPGPPLWLRRPRRWPRSRPPVPGGEGWTPRPYPRPSTSLLPRPSLRSWRPTRHGLARPWWTRSWRPPGSTRPPLPTSARRSSRPAPISKRRSRAARSISARSALSAPTLPGSRRRRRGDGRLSREIPQDGRLVFRPQVLADGGRDADSAVSSLPKLIQAHPDHLTTPLDLNPMTIGEFLECKYFCRPDQ